VKQRVQFALILSAPRPRRREWR